jgi:pimeloyl-ACP methyl ester carboxylesterase
MRGHFGLATSAGAKICSDMLRLLAVAIAAGVLCLALTANSDDEAASLSDSHPASHYERHENKDRVVVFVHGFFGDASDTWTCPKGVFWPSLLLRDTAFDDSDVYVAAYNSGDNVTIDEVVSSLNDRLEHDKVFEHREVVFVAHSLGGLVVRKLLLTHREYAQHVRFIYFFSTPGTGSQIARLGSIFAPNPLLREMSSGDSNDYLLSLEFEWKAAKFQSIRLYCAYEKKPTKGVIVVDRLSATRDCGDQTPIPINEDHIGIVKPCSPEDDSYIALKNAVRENPIAPRPKPSSRPPTTAGPSLTPKSAVSATQFKFHEEARLDYFTILLGPSSSIRLARNMLEKGWNGFAEVDGERPLRMYVEGNDLYIDAKVYDERGTVVLELVKSVITNSLPPGWDVNYASNAMEVVDANQAPVFQMIRDHPGVIRLNGTWYGKRGSVIASGRKLAPIFKYPYWKYPGQFADSPDMSRHLTERQIKDLDSLAATLPTDFLKQQLFVACTNDPEAKTYASELLRLRTCLMRTVSQALTSGSTCSSTIVCTFVFMIKTTKPFALR